MGTETSEHIQRKVKPFSYSIDDTFENVGGRQVGKSI